MNYKEAERVESGYESEGEKVVVKKNRMSSGGFVLALHWAVECGIRRAIDFSVVLVSLDFLTAAIACACDQCLQ